MLVATADQARLGPITAQQSAELKSKPVLCTMRLPAPPAAHCLTGSVARSSAHTLSFNLGMWLGSSTGDAQPLFTTMFVNVAQISRLHEGTHSSRGRSGAEVWNCFISGSLEYRCLQGDI